MGTVVVRYTTKSDRADDNARLIEDVFAELATRTPAGVRYAVFRDEASFVHVAVLDAVDGTNPLTTTPAFVEFQRELGDRLEAPPVVTDVALVGSYGFGLAGNDVPAR